MYYILFFTEIESIATFEGVLVGDTTGASIKGICILETIETLPKNEAIVCVVLSD